jgi:hypothetical protein
MRRFDIQFIFLFYSEIQYVCVITYLYGNPPPYSLDHGRSVNFYYEITNTPHYMFLTVFLINIYMGLPSLAGYPTLFFIV